ncbi:MAG: general stress protein [Chitinophagales bacterium]
MQAIIGVYDSHDSALSAVQQLQQNGFPSNQLSIIGKTTKVDDHFHVKADHTVEGAEVSFGVIAGSVIGVLSGIGIFAIPGFGFLFGAGALVGAFAGLELGVVGGGIAAVLTRLGVDSLTADKYEEYLKEGKFLIVAEGDEPVLKNAEQKLGEHGAHLELETH